MLFGMTNRAGWNGHDPNNNKGVWSLWDDFEIVNADLFGWWNTSSPVKLITTTPASPAATPVLATCWVNHGVGALIAIGSWNPDTVVLTAADFSIDLAEMGLAAETTALEIPTLVGFNDPIAGENITRKTMSAAALADLKIPVVGNKGWMLRLRKVVA
jgi:hypothetical protein